MKVLAAAERFSTRIDWLASWHSFSFGEHFDPERMGFRSLRVINDDVIAPGAGFGMHPHRDMEILTWVIEGAVAHRDSTGGQGVIRPGMVQRMSAGTGIRHSEFNASADEPVRLLQVWIQPDRRGHEPSYEDLALAMKPDAWVTVASPDGRDGSARLHQDAVVLAARLGAGKRLAHRVEPGRAAWIQVARGAVTVSGVRLAEGDGAALEDVGDVSLESAGDAEVLLFDLGG